MADAVWDTKSFADVLTNFVKVEVESVYTSASNGFKEIEFYHSSCHKGLPACVTSGSVFLLLLFCLFLIKCNQKHGICLCLKDVLVGRSVFMLIERPLDYGSLPQILLFLHLSC